MGLYESLENAYYGLMDKLSFIRVYDWFVNPIESRGIPSFPIFVLLLAVIAGVALFYLGAFNAAPQENAFTVSVLDAGGQPLSGASVKIVADGQSFYAKTNSKGVAEFKGLPEGKAAIATAQSAGFESASKEFNTADKTLTLRFSAGATPSPTPKIVVTVTSLLGGELGGVTLTYTDPSTGETKSMQTDATGRAEISFANADDFFNVRASLEGFKGEYKTCFASSGYCEIELTSNQQFETDDAGQQTGGDIEAKGSVRVDVRNEDGESVAARVTLYDADSVQPLSEGFSDDSGPAFFDSVAALGTSVYVIVEPEDSAAYASYNGGDENDLRTIASQTVFDVVLQPSGVVPTTRSDFKIVDGSADANEGTPVSGALVSLYSLANPLRLVASVLTDENGEASFEIAAGAQVYAVASADGFLPYLDRSVETGSSKTIALMPLVAGNNAVVRGLVVDDEGTPQELARVFIVTGDGFYSGLPVQETGADGWTEFSGVPVDGEYGFRATLGSRSGKSDFFTPAIEEEVNATVTLDPEVGFLTVSAEDAAGGNAVAARFDAIMVDSKEVYDSCSSKAEGSETNYSCELTVKAGKAFFVRATAADYASSESEEIVLAAEERAEKKLLMVSLNASRALKILSFELQPTGTDSTFKGDAKQLGNGRVYLALLTVNFPGGADANGAFLRVGDKQSADDENAVITYFDSGDSNDNVSVQWSSVWNEGDDCVNDLASQESGGAKWVNWEYASASSSSVFGVRTIAAKVFVKPEARSKDKISVYYRAYSRKKDVFYRFPSDAELGFDEKTTEKDWCRAAAQTRSYTVVEGEGSCTKDACIAVSFYPFESEGSDDAVPGGDGFKVKTNSVFNAIVSVRSFTGASGGSLRVAVDDALSLQSQESADGSSARIALRYDENGETGVTLPVKARLPSQQALLKFSLFEGSGTRGGDSIADAQRFVVVEGLAKMLLTVSPANLSVQTPSTLTVIVKRGDDGSPVEDARVSLRETDEGGFVFGGSPNGDYAVAGDGSEGRGLDGRYVFKRVNAALPGSFDVVVERKGFSSAKESVTVTASDFMEFSRDLNDLRLGCDPVSLEVSSALGLDLPVLASFNGVQCASLRGSGVTQKDANTWFFSVKKNKNARIELEPLRNGKCYLVFNSVLPSNGGASSATAWLNVNCSKFDVSPTPTPGGATNCSSVNCAACTESECKSVALNDSCEAKYARNPQGANVYVKCLQKETPAAACDAAHCSLCGEAECNALFATKNCTPLYSAPANAYGTPVFVNCTAYTAVDCSPAKFNFQNILARRLAQYHARALLDPQIKKTSVGASAKTQIVYDMAGLRVARTADNCKSDGALSVTCTKRINAIVPTNAMTFSIYNQFGGVGADFMAQISKDSASDCFRLERGDEASALDKLASLPASIGAALGVVPPQAANTWLIIFLPKDGCVQYYWKDNKLFARPAEGKDSLTLEIHPNRNLDYHVSLTMSVVPNEDDLIAKYAFMFTPYKMQSGSLKANVDSGIFVSNLQTQKKLVLTGLVAHQSTDNEAKDKTIYSIGEPDGVLVLPGQSVASTRVYYDLHDGKPAIGLTAQAGKSEFKDVEDGPVYLDPSAYASDSALQCSDGKCCNDAEYKAAKEALNAEANNVFKLILADVEEYYDGNIVDGNAALFKQATDDALADYMGQSGAYLICKNLGMDPLAKIKEACAERANSIDYLGSAYGTDQQTEGFVEIYQDSFADTACDSSLLNYAFGFGEAAAPGGTFTDVFANRLTGALQPRSGTYYKKKYVVPVDIQLNVTMKRGAAAKGGAGIEVYSIRPKDVESSDSAAGSGDWISLEGPKAFTGIGVIQQTISKTTDVVGVLTGCLSPYFGGTPELQKPVTARCQLGESKTASRLAYCVDGVEGQPNVGVDWTRYDDAETCWKDGVSAIDGKTCLDTLKALTSVSGTISMGAIPQADVAKLIKGVDPTFLKTTLQTLFGASTAPDKFYLNKKQYDDFTAKSISGISDVASLPLCFKTWAYNEVEKKYLNPTDPAASVLKQKWVCTPLYKLEDHGTCVPLADVFGTATKPPYFQPTQCLNGKPPGEYRCRGDQKSDAAGWQYKCDLPGEEKT